MADVAQRAGVSQSLVSIIFRGADGASDATRARVLAAAAQMGYRPDSLAQGLRRNRSRHLGVLFSLRRPFEVELVENMYPVVEELGYRLLLGPFTPGRGQDAVIDELLGYRCAGLIVVGPELHARDLESLVNEVAIVEVGRDVAHGALDVIRNDDAMGTRQAVDHLVQLGHRDIAYIDGGHNPGADLRRDGYLAAMNDHGLTGAARVISGGYTEEEGAQAGRRLLIDGLPTAVVAANDPCAIGLLDVVIRAGIRVPEDLSVIGYDDSRFGVIPGIDLTSVRQNIPRTARQAVKTVVARLDNPNSKPRHVITRPKLIVRGSTAPPPQHN
jgi:DNA-binding LacI/PurR family transcriptional regulator